MALVGERNTPEIARGVQNFDAQFKRAVLFLVPHADDAEFAHFMGKAVENLDAGAQFRQERQAEQRARAADGGGFGGCVEPFIACFDGMHVYWDTDPEAA